MTIRVRFNRAARIAPLLVAALSIPVRAQPAKEPAPINPTPLVIDAAAAPTPALKYRLLPSSADLNSGDAAPIYLRLRYETPDALWNEITLNYRKWRDLPLNQFPAAEVRKLLDQFAGQLEQIELGAHRQSCVWSYTVPEQRLDRVNIALTDVQGMRQWLFILDLKARVEIAEGKHDQAIRTIETGMAFSRHIALGPFLINGLVGLAGASILLDRSEELIAQPGAPNLYWALAVLPRPLIDFRHEIEIERTICEDMIPELVEAESSRQRAPAEWSALLARMHARIVKWGRNYTAAEDLTAFSKWDLAKLKAESLPAARAYLTTRPPRDAKRLAEMSDDQAVALYLAGRHHEIWDDYFKASYLPAREAIVQLVAAEKRTQAARTAALALFTGIMPSLRSVITNCLRIDRRVAVLRTIEALRLYAAAHGGKLPESLEEITEASIPADPATGAPFIYRASEAAGLLHGIRGELPPPYLSYRISIGR
jgi:hypothetical protein